MALDLRKLREIVQTLLRVWKKKDGDDVLDNVAQTSTSSGDGSDGKLALAGTGFSAASQPGLAAGDEAASQSPGTLSRPANVQTMNAAGLHAVERATQLGFGGTGAHQCPQDTKKGLSDVGVHAANFHLGDGEPDMTRKAPYQEKKLPAIRYKTSGEVNWQRRPLTSPPTCVAT